MSNQLGGMEMDAREKICGLERAACLASSSAREFIASPLWALTHLNSTYPSWLRSKYSRYCRRVSEDTMEGRLGEGGVSSGRGGRKETRLSDQPSRSIARRSPLTKLIT